MGTDDEGGVRREEVNRFEETNTILVGDEPFDLNLTLLTYLTTVRCLNPKEPILLRTFSSTENVSDFHYGQAR